VILDIPVEPGRAYAREPAGRVTYILYSLPAVRAVAIAIVLLLDRLSAPDRWADLALCFGAYCPKFGVWVRP
jgi:hypothetical protein